MFSNSYIVALTFATIFIISAFFIPKKLSKDELWTTSIFALYFAWVVDVFLGLYFNLYYYFEDGLQPNDYLIHLLMFPAINIVFLNLYPYRASIIKKLLFILIASMVAVVIEYIFIKFSFFGYTGWKLWWSASLYPIVYAILLLNLKITRHLKGKLF